MPYAQNTEVSVERSRAEIETLLRRHDCDAVTIGYDESAGKGVVQFRGQDRFIRFTICLPDLKAFERTTHTRQRRSAARQRRARDQALRQRWRALLLCIKAKLETVESGIETWEEAFMPQTVLPDNTTVANRILPAVRQAYLDGQMPAMQGLLPPAPEGP